jgi:hypothetical protein
MPLVRSARIQSGPHLRRRRTVLLCRCGHFLADENLIAHQSYACGVCRLLLADILLTKPAPSRQLITNHVEGGRYFVYYKVLNPVHTTDCDPE